MQFVPLFVSNILHETADAYTIEFDQPAEGFDYLPGQYLTLKVVVDGQEYRRAFSLSSCPQEDTHLSVTIKAIEDGRVSSHLKNKLNIGDTIEAYPPLGSFILHPDSSNRHHYVLIGAGSGITPLMSMLRSILCTESHSQVTLIYGNRDEDNIIFRDQLKELEKHYEPRLKVIHILSQPLKPWHGFTGRIDENIAREILGDVQALNPLPFSLHLCGPQGVMEAVDRAVSQLGIDPDAVHREYYTAPLLGETLGEDEEFDFDYDLVTRNVQVILDGKQHTVTVDPDSNILQAAKDVGLDPPYACEEGVCSTCRAKLHGGLIQMMARDGLSDEELEANYILTCQSVPLTDDVVVEFA